MSSAVRTSSGTSARPGGSRMRATSSRWGNRPDAALQSRRRPHVSVTAARIVMVAGLVGLGWAVGHAQAPGQSATPSPADQAALSGSSDFELVVSSAANGNTEVKCVRGCRLTWAPTVVPKNGPVEMLAPDVHVRGVLSPGTQSCLAPAWMNQNCRILGWKR